jgi:hypothetical protein
MEYRKMVIEVQTMVDPETNKRAKVWKQWDNVKMTSQGKWINGKIMC